MRNTSRHLIVLPRRVAAGVTVLLLSAGIRPVHAQTAGSLPLVLELPASTRAMALGDAYMMNAGHADAIFYHPALLTGASGFGLEVQRWGPQSSATAASAATQWFGGGVGIGLQTAQYGSSGQGSAAAPGGQDHLFTDGEVPVSERVATVGIAGDAFGFDVGVAGKLVEQRVGGSRATEVMMDVGVTMDVGPVIAGLTVRDLGEAPLDDEDGWDPARVVLGLGSYGKQVGIFDVGLSTSVSWSEEQTTLGGGLEVGYWPINGRTFVARVGVRQRPEGSAASPMSFGFAFWGDDLVLEWAYRPFGDLEEGTHRFGVRWR